MYNFWLWKLSKRLTWYRCSARQKGRFWAKFKNNNNIQAFLYRIISLASFSWRIYISVTNCFAWVPNYIGKVFKCWPPFWPEFRRVKCTTSMFVLEQQRCLYDFYQIWKKNNFFFISICLPAYITCIQFFLQLNFRRVNLFQDKHYVIGYWGQLQSVYQLEGYRSGKMIKVQSL